MEKIAILWPNELGDKEWLNHTDNLMLYEKIGVLNTAETTLIAEKEGAQAIICTSGIEAEVKRVSQLPALVVTTAYIDLLESLKILEYQYGLYHKRVALLLHSNNTARLERIAPYVKNDVTRFDFQGLSDIPVIFETIQEQGYDVILSGPTGCDYARKGRIPAYMLQYSSESILEAVSQMRTILSLSNQEKLQLQRLRAVIAMSPNAMVVTDAQGLIDICNEKSCRMFRRNMEEMTGTRLSDLLQGSSWQENSGQQMYGENMLIEIKKEDYFVTWQPILKGDATVGSVATFEDAKKIQHMENKYRALQAKGLTAKYCFDDIFSGSQAMEDTIRLAKAYANTDLTVLIEGETGTGKELFAQSIHNHSDRRYGPFVAINCAALVESLLESELMGYESGAFTDARKGGKIGLLELAHNGTIFLDEINQMPMQLQSKLLRVIQERSILRIGAERMIPINVRIIAATNEDLYEKVKRHEFRSDLYYRLNLLHLRLPSLRQRPEEIPGLIRYFAKDYSMAGLETDIEEILERGKQYDWPGNIRELQNHVCRNLVLLSQGISKADLVKLDLQEHRGEVSRDNRIEVEIGTFEEMKRQIISEIVKLCGGNQSEAAKRLEISRNTVGKLQKTED
ncbi:MAG: hypothetical protein DBX44_01350 [Oscillospiraceae bacterium]|nr:MAG: hypothetical protein DBX44_01350 [Oscillospiraceae bacterium]